MSFDEVAFRTKVITLFHAVYPTIPVVTRYQNKTQPVDISSGAELCDIHIEFCNKVGTDYVTGFNENQVSWAGDRLIQISMELFSPTALTKLNNFRDMLETYQMRELMRSLDIMEQRTEESPQDRTRLHGNTQYVKSAEYLTRFHATIEYIETMSSIEHSTIEGTVDSYNKTTTIITTI